jgi:hypothetical protein
LGATVNLSVIVLFDEDVNRMAWPVEPVVLVQAFSLFVQEEFDKFGFIIAGATV